MSDNTSVRVQHDTLEFGPVRVSFQRTLRIPETGMHDLPPGLGNFPIRRVEDYPDTAPAEWLARGGVMLPVYQREAMWLSFDSGEAAALQVGVGKVCALTGKSWSETLTRKPQNYAPIPEQPWLDGINSGDGFIRQFVAVPLGLGATVEGQVTGEEVHGGVQLRAVGLTADALKNWKSREVFYDSMEMGSVAGIGSLKVKAMAAPMPDASMGLGAGGKMRQEIYEDDRELRDYDESRSWRVFAHLCSASQWTAITGEVAPPTPIDREVYVAHGLPWFDYYDADREDIAASKTLVKVKRVGEILEIDDEPFTPTDPSTVITLKDPGSSTVTNGAW